MVIWRSGLLALPLLLTGVAQAADPIRIAAVGPVTGPVAQYGDMQFSGVRLAVEQINAKGGVLGRPLEAVVLDDACEPKQAVAVANRVVNEGIEYVVGHLCSGSTQPASDVYVEEGVLMITPASTSPQITAAGRPMLFRTIGLDSQQGKVAGEFIVDQVKPKRMAIIHDKQQYGQGVADEVNRTVNARGLRPVLYEGVNKGQTDFSALITKLKSLGVDFVYYGGYHPELGLLLRQSRAQGFDARFMGPEGVGHKDISAIAGAASEGLLVTLPADFAQDPVNADLVKALQAKGEDASGPFVMPSYAAVQVIAEAMEKAKSTDPEKVAKVLYASTFNTPIGEVAFDEKGDLKNFRFVIFEWHADGNKTPITQ